MYASIKIINKINKKNQYQGQQRGSAAQGQQEEEGCVVR
jgi:hypothetical protein